MTKKVIILLLLAAAALAIIIYFQGKEAAGPTVEEEITPQAATGNVDDLVASLLAEIDDEQLTLDEAAGDEALLFSDSEEIDAFNQSVDENEF